MNAGLALRHKQNSKSLDYVKKEMSQMRTNAFLIRFGLSIEKVNQITERIVNSFFSVILAIAVIILIILTLAL